VQSKGAGNAFPLPPGFRLRTGGGQPLPLVVQAHMEGVFGARFGDVRVHVGNEAPSIGALAFTHGSDVYFAPGQYRPNTLHGLKLIGHELTHVVQQRTGQVRNPLGTGVAVVQDVALEAQAERFGQRAMLGVRHRPEPEGGARPLVGSRPGVSVVSLKRVPGGPDVRATGGGRLTLVLAAHVIQCASEEPPKGKRYLTRILRADQVRRNIGTRTIRRTRRSIRRNIPLALAPHGKGTTRIKRLYYFMRHYGGGGLQGWHQDLGNRPGVIRQILEKMVLDPNRTTRSSRGKKFVMIAIDRTRLNADDVLDLTDAALQEEYKATHSVKPKSMYMTHRKEGVVATLNTVPHEAVVGIRAFRGVPSQDELTTMIDDLVNVEGNENTDDTEMSSTPVLQVPPTSDRPPAPGTHWDFLRNTTLGGTGPASVQAPVANPPLLLLSDGGVQSYFNLTVNDLQLGGTYSWNSSTYVYRGLQGSFFRIGGPSSHWFDRI
jgi:hypothetical protein